MTCASLASSVACMTVLPPPGEGGSKLTLPHGDPVAVELTLAIHGGDLDALRRLLTERPGLATVRMIGRKGVEGGWRTPLHLAADWPGYFPAAPAAVSLLLDAGADPNDDSGGDRPETPLHWAASSDDAEVAVALIDGGAELEMAGGSIGTPLDNAIGYGCGTSPGSWSSGVHGLTPCGRPRPSECFPRLEELVAGGPNEEEISKAFWHVCSGAQRRAAEYLLSVGADLNWVPDYAEGTPLDAASGEGPPPERHLLAD